MSNISKDQVIHNVKEAYKTVTRDTDTITYGNLPTKILNIKDKVNGWVKPADWPDIDSYTDDVVLLISDEYPIVAFKALPHSSSYGVTVNWGDGTTSNLTYSSPIGTHDYTNSTGGIVLNNGHKAYIIKVNAASHYLYSFQMAYTGTSKEILHQSWLELKINTARLVNLRAGIDYTNTPYNITSVAETLEYIDISACVAINNLAYTFCFAPKLQEVKFPNDLPSCTTAYMMFAYCPSLKKVHVPKMDTCTSFGSAFQYCSGLNSLTFEATSYPAVTTIASILHIGGGGDIVFPACPACTTATNAFYAGTYRSLKFSGNVFASNAASNAATGFIYNTGAAEEIDCTNVVIPDTVTSYSYLQGTSYNLRKLVLPAGGKKMGGTIASVNYINPYAYALEEFEIPSTWFSEATSTATLNAGFTSNTSRVKKLHLDCGLNLPQVICNGYSAASKGALEDVTIPHTKATYSGAAPQISFNNQNLGSTAITNLINQLPTLSGKTLSLVGCTAAPTQADIAAATAKGWSITV